MVPDINKETNPESEEKKVNNPTHKQEQSDPQLTELRGFIDPGEDLEPTLQDGKKSPEKAHENYKKDQEIPDRV
ncbi:MAG: hypothetical protein LH478_02995 [Chitinophagaceae bacterium]|nr:hypothetical protein [Chitinophagaceae bacterium]